MRIVKNIDFSISARIVKKMMLFRMVGILFGLFVWNGNGELRITTTIPAPPWNSSYSHYFGTTDLRKNRGIKNNK
jgi:hypothetical protein